MSDNSELEYTLLVNSLMTTAGVSPTEGVNEEDLLLRSLLDSWGFGNLFEILKWNKVGIPLIIHMVTLHNRCGIIMTFPIPTISRYFQIIHFKKSGNIPAGRLYDSYQNNAKRLRRLGILSPLGGSPIPSPFVSDNIVCNEEDCDDNNEVNMTQICSSQF